MIRSQKGELSCQTNWNLLFSYGGTAIVFKATNRNYTIIFIRQHRIIPALRLKHRSGGCGTASALPKCSIMSGCGTRIVLRGQKPLALCDRCPCFGSLFPPLAALTFAASSIICAFGLASAAPRSPYRHLELCGIAFIPFSAHTGGCPCPPQPARHVPACRYALYRGY